MQYVGRAIGSVSKTWNSINPATLSGAIDVIVIEQEDGELACSPFHIRFGKFALLQPSQKKVEFSVNERKVNFAMKLGEGGEAFFVFETDLDVPSDLLTSPVLSPSISASSSPSAVSSNPGSLQEPEYLDLSGGSSKSPDLPSSISIIRKSSSSSDVSSGDVISDPSSEAAIDARADAALATALRTIGPNGVLGRPDHLQNLPEAMNSSPELAGDQPDATRRRSGSKSLNGRPRTSSSSDTLPSVELSRALLSSFKSDDPESSSAVHLSSGSTPLLRPRSPPLSRDQAIQRAKELSRKLSISKIPTMVTDSGDLVLDMTGYKAGEEETARAESVARKILSEELSINADIASLIAPDEHGNLWIYANEDARERAKTIDNNSQRGGQMEFDYEPDELLGRNSNPPSPRTMAQAHTIAPELTPPPSLSPASPGSPVSNVSSPIDTEQRYVKTLRLTSEQLKSLNLQAGANSVSFSVNGGRAVCTARMFYWKYNVPLVISDIDGTITKSDALGHVLTMLGRDWTHVGVAKLFTDISSNGYNLMYLTSRSVGQADSTRHYLRGIDQGGYKLPDGPVILSPDRTIAALRREVIYRKPEVFKMACLRDIQSLFDLREGTPFYAGFGNRITDALSYRSVGVPSSRIFTINSNADVHMELLELAGYKSSYVHMGDLVDHFFPPVTAQLGDERFTDVNFWREPVPDLIDPDSESDEENTGSFGRDGEELDSITKKLQQASLLNSEEGSEYTDRDDDDEEDEEEEDEEVGELEDEEEYLDES
ncbi:Lipin/Ned1/Smp2-domain-containing protein [Lipomyces oligophaga]|uniref:Lipin/Ned1/Smp2-domain-containing protein n=1 Tax=Lipomyces oligophaga TaxID=45792 RepID=UPI0034CF5F2C